MSSSLVKCLRGQRIDGRSTDEIMLEAADAIESRDREIERLRAFVVELQERLRMNSEWFSRRCDDALAGEQTFAKSITAHQPSAPDKPLQRP